MKFTDGNWMMQKGVRVHHPAQVHEVIQVPDGLRILAPTKTIRHRGDTLDGPLLTIHLSSPHTDCIRVRISHFEGSAKRLPEFPLFEFVRSDRSDLSDIALHIDDRAATLTTGNLSARIARGGPWKLEFRADDRAITSSGPLGIGLADVEGEGQYLHEQLSLGVGECVYGLGERFTAFVKNGQVVESWNRDGGTGSDQAYKNVPFYMTNRGYGVFVNHPEAVSFEVASEKVSRVQFSVPGQSLEYILIYGPTPKEILRKYSALTGRPALPPVWSFGLWLSTSFTTSYDEETVTGFIRGMFERDLPVHVFHFDCFWMKEFRWCDFEWDERIFPDPPAMLRRLKDLGLRICVWINPYIAQLSPLFEEGKRSGFLIKKPDGGVWQSDQWQAGMGIVDFTNPEACTWYTEKLRALLDMGVDCFKTDFGERIPTEAAYSDGSDPTRMHNFYSYLYNKVVFDLLQEVRGEGEAVLFARSATAGCQQFPVHWGGDCYSSFESMAESLRGGLSLGLSGFGFWSHDIGGFEGTPPAAVYKRWIAFGLLSSHSRLHGSSSYRVPWAFDEEAVEVLRFFTKLKCRLMPYLFAKAVEAHESGIPMMRAMMMEFPDDPACDGLDRQYMLGDSLLVAPVFAEDGIVDYYVPSGTWTHLLTGQQIDGPAWAHESHSVLSLPLLVRPGAIIATGSQDSRPDYDFVDAVTIHVYALAAGTQSRAIITDQTGAPVLTVTAECDADRITLHSEGRPARWSAMLIGCGSVASVEGGAFQNEDAGVRIQPAKDSYQVAVTLSR